MKKCSLIALSMAVILFSACEKERIKGDGLLVTETRNPGNFSGIDMRVSADVNYTPSATYHVEVQAQQNILNVLETYVSNGKLVIRFENDVRIRTHDRILINLTAPSLSNLRISGSGNIASTGALTPSSMDMEISGSGNISIKRLETGPIDAKISGSGNIQVAEGSATEEHLRISGSGNMDLKNVVAKKATTNTSGSGDTWVNVSESLDVTISGSGSVYYKGSPVINTRISGSGKVLHN